MKKHGLTYHKGFLFVPHKQDRMLQICCLRKPVPHCSLSRLLAGKRKTKMIICSLPRNSDLTTPQNQN